MKINLQKTLTLNSILFLAGLFVFSSLEPVIVSAIENQFTVTQSVTAEISFRTPASNVTMSGSIAGLTGGTATGQTQVNVLTNNTAGYLMTIKSSSTPAMQGNRQGGTIADYAPNIGGVPDYAWTVGANKSAFGYTVSASTTSDLDPSFLDDTSSLCNTGSADTNADTSCWFNLKTAAETIVNRSTATTASGATTTIFFKTEIKANPAPAVPTDTYVATSTLTATVN